MDWETSINEWISSRTKIFKGKSKIWIMQQCLIMSNYVLLCLIMSDLSRYAAKTDLKNATGIDTPCVAKKVGLANLNLM